MILVFSIALLMVFVASAPAMACTQTPKHGSFTWYGIGVGTSPGTSYVDSNNVMHQTGATGKWTEFGAPWGGGVTTNTETNYITLNLETLTGSDVSPSVWTYPGAGVTHGIVFVKFNGLGLFTYNGPDITAYGITVHHGDMLFGLQTSAVATQFGTSGTLRGIYMITESSVGVTVSNPITGAPLYSVNEETYTYWFT